jgi:hypothetical protein
MTTTLRDVVRVVGSSHRSVQLTRDWVEADSLGRYILTPTAQDLATRICTAVQLPTASRAWSITGPYGVGKSAFALFLTDLLASERPRHSDATRLRKELGSRFRRLVPILVVGKRSPFVPIFLATLAEAMTPISRRVAKKAQDAGRKNRAGDASVATVMEEAAIAARKHGFGGLLIIIDEFGKFLEYAALHQDTEDLFIFQQLAESAARSSVPIILATILHTAFAEYLQSIEEAKRAEWQKVQGRFTDAAFLEPPEQMLGLIGASLAHSFPETLRTEYKDAVDRAIESPALKEAAQRFPLTRLLPDCVPLHPITALLLWPLFRSTLAQHERSLFAFLTSPEPFGVQDFLSSARWAGGSPPFYRVDRLWDYVTTALGAATYRGAHSRRWSEIEQALTRIGSDAHPLAEAVVKAVGLLGLYGRPVGLRPSQSAIALALEDPEGVSVALQYLEKKSILIYRKHEASYALWEGSDVDLDRGYQEGRQHTARAGLADRLKHHVVLRPMVARAHYFKTGALRYFTVDVIDGTEATLCEALGQTNTAADGRILYVLAPTRADRESLMARVCSITENAAQKARLQIFAFPKPMVGLEEALRDLEAWKWMGENTPALQGDPVARLEVRARVLHAKEQLEANAGSVLGLRGHAFEPQAVDWIHNGTRRVFLSGQAFQRWLSALCDEVYERAPTLHNELLNRSQLSSSAMAARRNLLEGMIARPEEPQLGFQGSPPEVSMYNALLAAGGFHRARGGRLQFGAPKSAWRPVWTAVERFLASTHAARRPVQELFGALKSPPYGLRDGVLPVVLCSVLLSRRDDVALYEDGAFVPELRIEVLERLIRTPQAFEIQQYTFGPQDHRVFNAVDDAIRTVGATTDEAQPRLLQVVKPLVLFAARLPMYTRRTNRLKAQTLAVRDALLGAKDPHELLFVTLPDATGSRLGDEATVHDFGHRLRNCLQELRRAFPQLLDEIESQFRQAFDLAGTYEEARKQLQERASILNGFATDRKIALFVKEASRVDDRDWREVLARIIQGGLPPAQWSTNEVESFQVQLQRVRSEFTKLEELVAEQRRSGANMILRIGLLDGQVREAREIVALTPERSTAVLSLAESIRVVLTQRSTEDLEEDRRIRLAALAKVAAEHLQSLERAHE